jgi:hypothetical protein
MPSYWLETRFKEKGLPDAFAGPILSLIEAIAADSELATAGRDNLKSLRLAFAVQRSQRINTPVRPDELPHEALEDERSGT